MLRHIADTRGAVGRVFTEEATAHPVDSRSLEIARYRAACIALKQTFAAEGKEFRRKAASHAEPGRITILRTACVHQRHFLRIY